MEQYLQSSSIIVLTNRFRLVFTSSKSRTRSIDLLFSRSRFSTVYGKEEFLPLKRDRFISRATIYSLRSFYRFGFSLSSPIGPFFCFFATSLASFNLIRLSASFDHLIVARSSYYVEVL